MLDAAFYAQVLNDLMLKECRARPGQVPVVHLHLGDNSIVDVCHIVQLAPAWICVAFYRDPESCDDMDFAFLPYGLVSRLTVSFHPAESRKLGFHVEEHAAGSSEEPTIRLAMEAQNTAD